MHTEASDSMCMHLWKHSMTELSHKSMLGYAHFRVFNPFYTEFHFIEVFLKLSIPCIIHTIPFLALETWAKGALRVHDLDHTHSLVCLQWSGLSDQQMLLLTENSLQYHKRRPYKGEEQFYARLCQKESYGPASANLQPAKTATMCMACLEYACPPPAIAPFC